MLLHDDEMEALEAALSFVDAFSHDGSVILHASEAPRGPPIQSSSPSVPTSVGLSGGGGVIADEELESLLLEVGLSGSPSTNSGVKTEPAALVAPSQAASPTDSAAVANNSFTQVNSNDSENARRGSRGAEAVWTHFRGSEKHRGNLYENFSKDVESSSDTVAEITAMPLLFGDDEVEALEAALSYVEALPPTQPALEISAASSTTAFPEGFGAGDEEEVRLDAELDRLLLGTLSSSSEHVSDSTPMAAMSTTLVTTPMASSLSSPLPLMVANVGAPNVSGQTRRRSRAAKGPTTTLAKRRVKRETPRCGLRERDEAPRDFL
ncbi:hypothetical protein PI126_g8066 [Phytophthora idaei]|nr:hypothetical protein PI126_g8066 [Phytophthora idaei]